MGETMKKPETPSVCRVCGHAGDFQAIDPVRRLFRCQDCRQMVTGDGRAWLDPFKPQARPQRKRPTPWWDKRREGR